MNEWADKIRAMNEPDVAIWLHDINDEISSHEKLISQWRHDLEDIDRRYPLIIDSRVEEVAEVYKCNIDRSTQRIEILRARKEIVEAILNDKVKANAQT